MTQGGIRVVVMMLMAGTAIAENPVQAKDVPLSPVGFPFDPVAPQPLTPQHPLYHRIALDPVAEMPSVVGSGATGGLIGTAKRSSFEKALAETLEKLNMLAPTEADAKVRLSPKWIELDSPLRISFSSHATAQLAWRLTRIDNGQEIFSREIETSAESRGGSGNDRAVGVGRVALMANIASAVVCIDKAAYGKAPDDCALKPAFTYRAPTVRIRFLP